MPIPGLGDVLFAARSEDVREFLAVPASAFTPPMPNPIEPVVGDGSIILLDGEAHKKERARFLPALHGDHHEPVRQRPRVSCTPCTASASAGIPM